MNESPGPGAAWPPPVAPDAEPRAPRHWPFPSRDAVHRLTPEARARFAAPGLWLLAWPAAILGSGFVAGILTGIVAGFLSVARGEPAPGVESLQAWLMPLIAAAYLGAAGLFWLWSRGRGFVAAVFAWRPGSTLGDTAIAVLFLVAAMYVGAQANLAIREIAPAPIPGPVVGPGAPPVSLLFVIPAVVLMGPIVEEIVFRGWMQPALIARGMHTWAAIAVSAAIFGLMHAFDGVGVIAYTFVLGLFTGAARALTGRLWAPLLMHVANNAIVVAAGALASG